MQGAVHRMYGLELSQNLPLLAGELGTWERTMTYLYKDHVSNGNLVSQQSRFIHY